MMPVKVCNCNLLSIDHMLGRLGRQGGRERKKGESQCEVWLVNMGQDMLSQRAFPFCLT